MTLQILHIIYSSMIRSFYSKRDQIIDLTNEATYFILIVMISRLTEDYQWTKKATFMLVGTIIAYSWFLSVVAIITFIQILKDWSKGSKNSVKKLNSEESREKSSKSYPQENYTNEETSNDLDEDQDADSLVGQETQKKTR